jgi:hypothetical protein
VRREPHGLARPRRGRLRRRQEAQAGHWGRDRLRTGAANQAIDRRRTLRRHQLEVPGVRHRLERPEFIRCPAGRIREPDAHHRPVYPRPACLTATGRRAAPLAAPDARRDGPLPFIKATVSNLLRLSTCPRAGPRVPPVCLQSWPIPSPSRNGPVARRGLGRKQRMGTNRGRSRAWRLWTPRGWVLAAAGAGAPPEAFPSMLRSGKGTRKLVRGRRFRLFFRARRPAFATATAGRLPATSSQVSPAPKPGPGRTRARRYLG